MSNADDLGNSIMTIRYKIVFVGDMSVGKTSVMDRFINNKFSNEYEVINFFFFFLIFIGNNRCRFYFKNNRI